MPRPALVKDVVTHQAQALDTLIVLMNERGMRCNAPSMCMVEGLDSTRGAAAEPEEPDVGCSARRLTLAQMASENRLSRVTWCAVQLLVVEKSILDHLPLDHQFTMQLKDSIEFRNICTHMALQTDDRRFTQDLNSAQECLAAVISNMSWDVSAKTCYFCETVQEQLKQILQKLHED